MNKWCFLLIAACLLAPDTGHAALKARDDVKAEDAFNPNPAPDDLILPMPCGQSMVLKAVGVRGKGLLWDLETRFGRRDGGSDDRGYYDSPTCAHDRRQTAPSSAPRGKRALMTPATAA